jgi:hypothetical protein
MLRARERDQRLLGASDIGLEMSLCIEFPLP